MEKLGQPCLAGLCAERLTALRQRVGAAQGRGGRVVQVRDRPDVVGDIVGRGSSTSITDPPGAER